jgi:hypothetical protein
MPHARVAASRQRAAHTTRRCSPGPEPALRVRGATRPRDNSTKEPPAPAAYPTYTTLSVRDVWGWATVASGAECAQQAGGRAGGRAGSVGARADGGGPAHRHTSSARTASRASSVESDAGPCRRRRRDLRSDQPRGPRPGPSQGWMIPGFPTSQGLTLTFVLQLTGRRRPQCPRIAQLELPSGHRHRQRARRLRERRGAPGPWAMGGGQGRGRLAWLALVLVRSTSSHPSTARSVAAPTAKAGHLFRVQSAPNRLSRYGVPPLPYCNPTPSLSAPRMHASLALACRAHKRCAWPFAVGSAAVPLF